MLIALAAAQRDWVPATPSMHGLGLGLPGYLILFAPLAFAPQRQLWSSAPVSPASSELSPEISQVTYHTAYAPFTPNNSEQRSHPLYYRGCWHRVSRCFLSRYRLSPPVLAVGVSSLATVLYDPKTFITHAALLRQAFAHCARFPTAASRRSLDRVSVPVWLIILSDQLPVVALVGFYPAN